MTRHGRMLRAGDVILARLQFPDTFEVKTRPALVLFAELGNIVVAGITSNRRMEGVPLLRREGAVKDSVIKLNYIFTISEILVKKRLFPLSDKKRKMVREELAKRIPP